MIGRGVFYDLHSKNIYVTKFIFFQTLFYFMYYPCLLSLNGNRSNKKVDIKDPGVN